MANSSKKSLRPSPSQPEPGAAKPASGKKKGKDGTAEARRPGADPSISRPFGTGGKYLKLPLFLGYSVYIEKRQFSLLFLSVVLYLFAAFVASEWIYLLSAGFFMALVLGVLLPLISLMGLRADYAIPQDVGQLESTTVRVFLKRVFPFGPLSWLIPTRALRMTLSLVRRGTDGKPSQVVLSPDPVYIDKLKREEWYRFPTPGLKRGIYFLESVELSTCFPFGVAWWCRSIDVRKLKSENAVITVYPAVMNISGTFLYKLSGIVSPMGQATSSSVITHQSSSFRSVREFKSGDSLRHIHWASSARQGKMLVREYDSEMLPIFDIMLNLRANYRNDDQFELAVNLVNSLVHLGHNLGHMPRLILNPPMESADIQALMFDLPPMPPGLSSVAEILARVEQITKVAANRTSFDIEEEAEDQRDAWSKINDRPILTVLPSGDKIMKYDPGKGDIVCCPVDIIEVPADWALQEEVLLEKNEKSADFKSARGAGSKSKATTEMGPVNGTHIARVEWEGDFQSL